MMTRATLELNGVGDRELGEWTGATDRATHLRRRLSAADMAALPAGHRTLVDVRQWDRARIKWMLNGALRTEPDPRHRAAILDLARQEIATYPREES